MAIIDPILFFAKTTIPNIGGAASGSRRVPFTFTSTKRLISSGSMTAIATSRDLAKKNAKETLRSELQVLEGLDAAVSVGGTLGMSSAISAGSASPQMPIISMAVNPSSVRWSQPKRYTKRDTMGGSVFFHFSDENGRNNDILTLSFSGNTGNISTQDAFDYNNLGKSGLSAVTTTGADIKLRTWHELYGLTREEILLPGGVKNDFFITYRTVLMPTPITLIGFFNTVMDFTESADKPFSRDYSFSFTVTDTSPKLNDLVDKINNALALTGVVSAGRSVL